MIAQVDWTGPLTPPPAWDMHVSITMDWDASNSWYHGITPPATDQIEAWFLLDLITGAYTAYLTAIRSDALIMAISSNPASTTPGEPIDVTISEWIGIPFTHTCTAHFTT